MEVDAPSSENPQPIATTNVEGAGAISDEEAGETTEILSSAEKKVFDSSVHVMRKEMVHLVILRLRFLNFLFRSAVVVPMPRSALITSTQRGRRSAFDVSLIVRSARRRRLRLKLRRPRISILLPRLLVNVVPFHLRRLLEIQSNPRQKVRKLLIFFDLHPNVSI
jgi:hypothetical protein